MAGTATKLVQVTAEIRPGVFRPDWEAVKLPAARRALAGRMAARAGLIDRWAEKLEVEEDLVWRAVLRLYARNGRSPHLAEIGPETALPPERSKSLLRKLQSRDLLALDEDAGIIRYAYPFTEVATGIQVVLGEKTLNALCAIDALGVGDMYDTDIAVESRCRACGGGVRVATASSGRELRDYSPAGAVVWYDLAYSGSASSSCCPAIAFFCADEHLGSWLDGQSPRRAGFLLSVQEALELGRAIFGPVLRNAKTSEDA